MFVRNTMTFIHDIYKMSLNRTPTDYSIVFLFFYSYTVKHLLVIKWTRLGCIVIFFFFFVFLLLKQEITRDMIIQLEKYILRLGGNIILHNNKWYILHNLIYIFMCYLYIILYNCMSQITNIRKVIANEFALLNSNLSLFYIFIK